MKSFMKELVLVLLLLLAIVLVLGIFLYDYIPTNKIVPKIEQYQVPNNIKQELKQSVNDLEDQQTQIIYEIDGTDLQNYEKTKDYQKGKVNPFAQDQTAPSTQPGGNTGTNDPTNTNTNTNSSNTTNTKNPDSVGNYLPNTGTK